MIKLVQLLKSTIQSKFELTEGVRVDSINHQVKQLEDEWERLDSQGTGHSRQMQIQAEIAKLWREKEKWKKLYSATGMPINESKSDDTIYGGIWSTERIVAYSYDEIGPGHTREMGPNRWTYYQKPKLVFWQIWPQFEDSKIAVENWLTERGYKVDGHRNKNDYYDIMKSFYGKKEKQDEENTK